MTFGEVFDRVVECRTAEEAEAFVVECEAGGVPRATTLHNIGYLTGYMSTRTADRVCELFKTFHPIFGDIHAKPDPDALQLFPRDAGNGTPT